LGGLAQIGVQVSEVIGVSERRENRQHSFRGWICFTCACDVCGLQRSYAVWAALMT